MSDASIIQDPHPAPALAAGKTSILRDLLGTIPVADFLEQVYLRYPFVCEGGCRHLLHLCDSTVFQTVKSRSQRSLIGHKPTVTIARKHWYSSSDDGEAAPCSPRGDTTIVQNVEYNDWQLGKLARAFTADLDATTHVHLYRTSAGRAELDWQNDPEEVFILQTVGSKEWVLRKNRSSDSLQYWRAPWLLWASPRGVEPFPGARLHEQSVVLEAGDWLYVPRGCWHRTRAVKKSYSVSAAVQVLTPLDLLKSLLSSSERSMPRWLQRIPAPPRSATWVERQRHYLDYCAALGKEVSELLPQAPCLDRFMSEYSPSPVSEPAVSDSPGPDEVAPTRSPIDPAAAVSLSDCQ